MSADDWNRAPCEYILLRSQAGRPKTLVKCTRKTKKIFHAN